MKTHELAKWLQVSPSTIKNWSTEFADYLQPSAQGGDGSRRYFDEQDARVMAFIAGMREINTATEDIHGTLAAMQRGDWAELPEMPDPPIEAEPVSYMPTSLAQVQIEQQRQALTREIAILTDRVGDLEAELQQERTAHHETRQELTEQLMTATSELGQLHGQLDTLKSTTEHERALVAQEREATAADRARERQLLTRALVAVAIAAAVLLTVVVLLALTGGPGG